MSSCKQLGLAFDAGKGGAGEGRGEEALSAPQAARPPAKPPAWPTVAVGRARSCPALAARPPPPKRRLALLPAGRGRRRARGGEKPGARAQAWAPPLLPLQRPASARP